MIGEMNVFQKIIFTDELANQNYQLLGSGVPLNFEKTIPLHLETPLHHERRCMT